MRRHDNPDVGLADSREIGGNRCGTAGSNRTLIELGIEGAGERCHESVLGNFDEMTTRILAVMISVFFFASCWNGGSNHVHLGDVSVGQQLIDLKLALDRNAISQDEYLETKKTLLALNAICENTTDEDE